jgi:uncharacterized membrane protein
MGESRFATWPVAAYGVILMMCAIAWEIERRVLLNLHDTNSVLVRALGGNFKEGVSVVLYLLAIASAFVNTWIACALYALVAAIWFVPDRRIERALEERDVQEKVKSGE